MIVCTPKATFNNTNFAKEEEEGRVFRDIPSFKWIWTYKL